MPCPCNAGLLHVPCVPFLRHRIFSLLYLQSLDLAVPQPHSAIISFIVSSRFVQGLQNSKLWCTLITAFGSVSGCSAASCTSVAWCAVPRSVDVILLSRDYDYFLRFEHLQSLATCIPNHTNVFCSLLYNNAYRRCHGWGRHDLFWFYRIWWSLLHGWRGETEDSHSP